MALGRGLFRKKVEAPPVAERRRSVRHVTVLQVAKLRTPAGEELCLLRDVSDEGLKAEVYSAVAAGEPVTVELRTGHCVGGTVAWVERPMIGVHFQDSVPILSMLAHCAFDDRLSRLRPPRIEVDLPATLILDEDPLPVRILNVSQAGMCIHVGRPMTADGICQIALPALGRRGARLRWSHRGDCGLQLDHPLAYREFAAWRAALPPDAA